MGNTGRLSHVSCRKNWQHGQRDYNAQSFPPLIVKTGIKKVKKWHEKRKKIAKLALKKKIKNDENWFIRERKL